MFLRNSCLLRQISILRIPKLQQVVGFKSQYSLDKIYPNSDQDFLSNKHTDASSEEFTGYIPIDDVELKYSRSGGPGGQHVNKTNSKVEVRFHVMSAEWIPQANKLKLMEQERNKINKDGYLIVTSEKTRKQMLNQADCFDKIRQMVRTACIKEYEPTEEELKIMERRKEKARKEMLQIKRNHSVKKQFRKLP